MSMLLGGAEKISPSSSVMMAIWSVLPRSDTVFVRYYGLWWDGSFDGCLVVEDDAHG